MPEDILSEAPLYNTGMARGFEKGYREGRRDGYILAKREIVIDFLGALFPHLIPKAQELLPTIDDLGILLDLIRKLALVKSEEEAANRLQEAAQRNT